MADFTGEVVHRPKKIISVSLPRSGTTSLHQALNILEFKPVLHLSQLFFQLEKWKFMERAADASYPSLASHTGEPFSRDDWEELFGPYEGLTDIAGSFPAQMIEAYPEAKFILMTRDFDGWARSIDSFLANLFGWRGWIYSAVLEPLAGSYVMRAMRKMIMGQMGLGASRVRDRRELRRLYDEHHALVRRLVGGGGDRLCEYRLDEGWEPLCAFLGKEVPDVEFPHLNKAAGMDMSWHYLRRLILYRAGVRVAWWAAPATVVGLGLWFYRQRIADL